GRAGIPAAVAGHPAASRTVNAALSRACRVLARASAPAGPAASAIVRTGREGVTPDGHELD
ncbi:hypothetical protein, partial [Dietzia sp. HMSC21D01]|uniref:hypothetical protein n=1 Tax=Dietzia sp. HMSC21D01 TaxID=1581054 RepID=UPI001AEF3E86